MKKLISVILCIILSLSAFGAGAASAPEFMKNLCTNYTANYTLTVRLNNADEIIDALKEFEMPDEINNFINVKSLLESMCASDVVMNVCSEISSDFRRIKLSVTAEGSQSIVINRNNDILHHSKAEIWLDMDLDARRFVVAFSTPINEKYAVIDSEKDFSPDEVNNMFDLADKMLNRETMEKINGEIVDIAAEHAEINVLNNTCTVSYDNDSFTALVSDVYEYISAFNEEMQIPSDSSADMRYTAEDIKDSVAKVRFLGNEGITGRYVLSGNKIETLTEKVDLSLSISDIVTNIMGESWDYNYSGDVNMTIECMGELTNQGKTKVEIPEFNVDNSFSIVEMTKREYEAGTEWEEPAMAYYVWGSMEKEVFDNERFYMPLRYSIEYAYGENVSITYDDGLVTIISDCGNTEEDINAVLRVGEDTATVNGKVYEKIGAFKKIDNRVYASVEFYEKCLGWTLIGLSKDLLDGSVSYSFTTTTN